MQDLKTKFPYSPQVTLSQELLDELVGYDTPTICNSLELIDPARKTFGYTKGNFVLGRPEMGPVIGYARTGEIRSANPFDPDEKLEMAMAFFEYVSTEKLPVIIAMQDLDFESAVGANWGEVHTRLFKRLGSLGTVTNGAIRDLDVNHPEYQLLGARTSPSHRYVRLVSFAREVDLFGMVVKHGDLIHMDRHGAVCFPCEMANRLPAAIQTMIAREKLILDVVDSDNFNLESLREAYLAGRKIH